MKYNGSITISLVPHCIAEADSPLPSQAIPAYEHIRAMRKPDWGDVCWLAGLFEGEGSFAVHEVKIPQKETEILYWCRELFGGSVRGPHRTTSPYTGKTYWRYVWSARDQRARSIVFTIYHLLSSRRRTQARSFNVVISRDEDVPQPDQRNPTKSLWDWMSWKDREFWYPE